MTIYGNCPRCKRPLIHRDSFYWGPCQGCRDDLRFGAYKRRADRQAILWLISLVPNLSNG